MDPILIGALFIVAVVGVVALRAALKKDRSSDTPSKGGPVIDKDSGPINKV